MMKKDFEKRESLEKQIDRAEAESRMVLPGIQALFGFQLIAVFNQPFFDRLRLHDQKLHLGALICTAFSALLIMTPAAYHRQAEKTVASRRFADLISKLLPASMIFLAVGISIDVAVVSRMILNRAAIGTAFGFCFFIAYTFAWFGYPRLFSKKEATA